MEKSRKKSLKYIVLLVLFMGAYVNPVWARDGKVWDELVKRANKFYQQAEEEREKGNLVMALTLLSKASFMFPGDERVKVKLDNLILKLRQKLEIGENCNDQVLEKRLKEALQELNALKKQMVEEKEVWEKYYQEKIEELKQAYEEKIKVLEEEHKFEMEKKEQVYKDILLEKQNEYKKKLSQIKENVKQNLKEVQAQLEEQNKVLADKNAKIKKLLESYSVLEQNLKARYQDKISSLKNRLSDTIVERNKLNLRIEKLEAKLKEKQDKIQTLSTKYESLSRDYRNLKGEIEKKISSREREYQECLSNVEDLQDRVRIMKNDMETLRLKKENVDRELSLMRDKVKEQKQALSVLRKGLEEKDIVIHNLKSKIENLTYQQFSTRVGGSSIQHKVTSSSEKPKKAKQFKKAKKGKGLEDIISLSVEEIFNEAMKAIDTENYKLAKKLLMEVLKRDPDNTVAKYMLDSVNLILED